MSTVRVLNPYDQAVVAELPRVTEAEAFSALEEAHAVYRDRDRWLPLSERLDILERAQAIVRDRQAQLIQDAVVEGGKPLMDSTVEIQRGIEGIRAALREAAMLAGREIPMGLNASSAGRFAVTHFEPKGVVFAISAFNHPFNLIIHQVIPAVAAGCPFLVKPSSATPVSCQNILGILHEAGLPESHGRMVLCDNATAEKISSDPRTAFLTFIGSAKVGWHLRSRLAPGGTCTLEHGGLAPVIVDKSADLDVAVPRLTKGGFYHAGQVCVSVQRVYVDQAIHREFLDRFIASVEALQVGDPREAATEVGPLIHPAEVIRVANWVQEASAAGGRVVTGGKQLSPSTYAPTVVDAPPDGVRLSTQEVFGPVVAVYPYNDRMDAIRRANAPDAYFQGSVFARDLDVALDTARRLQGTAVMINDHTAFRVDWMPFGGHRASGLGYGGIGCTLREMSLERMMVFRSEAL